jgi:hypothetical protein
MATIAFTGSKCGWQLFQNYKYEFQDIKTGMLCIVMVNKRVI